MRYDYEQGTGLIWLDGLWSTLRFLKLGMSLEISRPLQTSRWPLQLQVTSIILSGWLRAVRKSSVAGAAHLWNSTLGCSHLAAAICSAICCEVRHFAVA